MKKVLMVFIIIAAIIILINKSPAKKKTKEAQKKQRESMVETKEFRLSVNIDIHDFNTRVNNAKKAFEKGNKVKASIRFKGRQIAHPELAKEVLEKTSKIVVIDHHRKVTDSINDAILSYHEIYASSTCELVTELLQYMAKRVVIRQIEAEALYAGIIIDTKNLGLCIKTKSL